MNIALKNLPSTSKQEFFYSVCVGEDSMLITKDYKLFSKHYLEPITRFEGSIIQKFYTLASTWRSDVLFTSSITKMVMHPAYQQIIGMGRDVVPLLLRELEQRPHHWFWALEAITGVDPIKPEHQGKVKDMAEAWLQWGKENGYKW